ncbi:MAG: hypothetical protein ACFFCS_16260 [Candidatus Hodarchaeota archaeon]
MGKSVKSIIKNVKAANQSKVEKLLDEWLVPDIIRVIDDKGPDYVRAGEIADELGEELEDVLEKCDSLRKAKLLVETEQSAGFGVIKKYKFNLP